jgi:hypothetical protein
MRTVISVAAAAAGVLSSIVCSYHAARVAVNDQRTIKDIIIYIIERKA